MRQEAWRKMEAEEKEMREQIREEIMEAMRRDRECGVCLDRAKNCTLNPCGHQTCVECAHQLDKCPICSVSLFSKTKVFN